MSKKPFVSIVTPVYNGGSFIAECIESVLKQDYNNWEYIIVNNCSTDDTLPIISSYSDREKRIKLIDNKDFVDAETNHNIAFRNISPESQYCKVVSADDWRAVRSWWLGSQGAGESGEVFLHGGGEMRELDFPRFR